MYKIVLKIHTTSRAPLDITMWGIHYHSKKWAIVYDEETNEFGFIHCHTEPTKDMMVMPIGMVPDMFKIQHPHRWKPNESRTSYVSSVRVSMGIEAFAQFLIDSIGSLLLLPEFKQARDKLQLKMLL